MTAHRLIDQRSLALDRLIASRLRQNPDLVEKARGNLRRWLPHASPGARRTLEEWESILDGDLGAVIAVLEASDDRSNRLRQASPFCGILSREDRVRILKQFRPHDASPA